MAEAYDVLDCTKWEIEVMRAKESVSAESAC